MRLSTRFATRRTLDRLFDVSTDAFNPARTERLLLALAALSA